MTALEPALRQAEAPPRELSLIEAVREALREEMLRDDRVVVLGDLDEELRLGLGSLKMGAVLLISDEAATVE